MPRFIYKQRWLPAESEESRRLQKLQKRLAFLGLSPREVQEELRCPGTYTKWFQPDDPNLNRYRVLKNDS